MRIDRKKLMCLMLDKNLNQKELGEAAGLTRNTICAVKNGKSCNHDTASKIAKALNIDVTEIIEE